MELNYDRTGDIEKGGDLQYVEESKQYEDRSPMSRSTQKEMNNARVILPWRPRDMVEQLTYTSDESPMSQGPKFFPRNWSQFRPEIAWSASLSIFFNYLEYPG
jgi:hypothetical protein